MNKTEQKLYRASKVGDIDTVIRLLNTKRLNIDWQNDSEKKMTALHVTAQKGHLEILKELLRCGANPNLKDTFFQTPLHYAAHHGHVLIVRELILGNALIDVKNTSGSTPLHIASWRGHVSVIKELIAYNANINLQNKLGSALRSAVTYGKVEVVEELIKNGANIDLKNEFNETPLHHATIGNCKRTILEVIKILTDHSIDIDAQDALGNTPLHWAVLWGNNLLVTKELILQGADVTIKNKSGKTPLDIAIQENRVDIVKLFKELSI